MDKNRCRKLAPLPLSLLANRHTPRQIVTLWASPPSASSTLQGQGHRHHPTFTNEVISRAAVTPPLPPRSFVLQRFPQVLYSGVASTDLRPATVGKVSRCFVDCQWSSGCRACRPADFRLVSRLQPPYAFVPAPPDCLGSLNTKQYRPTI